MRIVRRIHCNSEATLAKRHHGGITGQFQLYQVNIWNSISHKKKRTVGPTTRPFARTTSSLQKYFDYLYELRTTSMHWERDCDIENKATHGIS